MKYRDKHKTPCSYCLRGHSLREKLKASWRRILQEELCEAKHIDVDPTWRLHPCCGSSYCCARGREGWAVKPLAEYDSLNQALMNRLAEEAKVREELYLRSKGVID